MMRHTINILGFAIFFIGLAYSCKNGDEAARKYISESEAQWAESVATNDTSVLSRILADDFIWVLDGKKWTKRMAIADAQKGPGDFISDHLDSASIRFFQNTAVAVGTETWTRKRNDGSTFQGKFIWSDTWIKRNNLWQIVQAEDITVPCHAK
jgi:hypothetical protein